MFSRIHQKLGTAGFAISIVALIAALVGAAWAAQGLNGKQKNEVKAIAKQYAGKKGPKGPKGATGEAGPAGPTGPAGPAGAKGDTGSAGTAGTNGKSIETGTEAAATANCEGRGGAWVQPEGTPASRKYACNGKEGSPWTAGGVLPSGKTETGTWSGAFEGAGFLPISFPIPLAAAPTGQKIVGEGATPPAECDDGVAPAPSPTNPEADPGYLCVFVGAFEAGGEVTEVFGPAGGGGASKVGGMLFVTAPGANIGSGSFAVTAP